MMQLPIRTTLEEWQRADTENPIFAALQEAQRHLDGVVNGDRRFALIFAPDSVGFEQVFEQTRARFTRAGRKPVLPGIDNAGKLLNHFQEASGSRPIMVSEAKALLASPAALQLITSAVDPMANSIRRVGSEKAKRTINLRVPLILVTATEFGALPQASRDHLQKVIYKHQLPVEIPHHIPRLWEYLVYQALFSDLLVSDALTGVALEEAIRAADFAIRVFTENMWNLAVVGRETLINLARFSRQNPTVDSLPNAASHPQLGPMFSPPSSMAPVGAQPNWGDLLRERRCRHAPISETCKS